MKNKEKRTQDNKKALRMLSLGFCGFGIVFLVLGWFFHHSLTQFKASSVTAELLVLRVESRVDDEGDTMFKPHFRATSETGRELDYAGHSWVSPQPHYPGDIVAGRVDWDGGEIRSNKMMWLSKLLAVVFGGFGVLFSGIGIGVYWFFARERKRPRRI